MRTILIIQSLIILLGSYYVFTLSQKSSSDVVGEVNNNVATDTDQILIDNQSNENSIATSSSIANPDTIHSSSPSDYGMEYPVADDNPQVQ